MNTGVITEVGGFTLVAAELLSGSERRGNAFEETVHRLLQGIRLGLVEPGARLPAERELATLAGVSRDTVRDAIAALVAVDYLVVKRGRYGGTFVTDRLPPARPLAVGAAGLEPETEVTAAEVRDVLATRRVVETGIARTAAETELSGADRDRLWQAFEACNSASPQDYRRMDSRLHILLAELVESPSLLQLAADTRMRVNNLLERIPLLPPNLSHSNAQHEQIVKAVLRGQPEIAQEAMREHLEGSEVLLQGFLS